VLKYSYLEKSVVVFFIYSIFLKYGGGVFHLIDSTLSLLISFAISLIVFKKKSLLIFNYINIRLIFCLLIIMAIGLTYTNALNYGANKLLGVFILIFLSIPIIPVLIKRANYFSVICMVFLSLYILAIYIEYGSFQFIVDNADEKLRLGGAGGGDDDNFHPIGISRFVCFCLVPIICNLFYYPKYKIVLISSGLIFISLIILFLAATRGPVLALMIIVFIPLINSQITKKKIITISSFFGLGVFYLFSKILMNDILFAVFTKRANAGDEGRIDIISNAADMALEFPLFGHGTGNYGFYHAGIDVKMYPHNIFAEIFYENGLIGLFLLLMIFTQGLIKFNRINKNKNGVLFFSLFIYFLINAQFSGDIQGNIITFIFLIAFLYNHKKLKTFSTLS
jgi:O-antigen ligase